MLLQLFEPDREPTPLAIEWDASARRPCNIDWRKGQRSGFVMKRRDFMAASAAASMSPALAAIPTHQGFATGGIIPKSALTETLVGEAGNEFILPLPHTASGLGVDQERIARAMT